MKRLVSKRERKVADKTSPTGVYAEVPSLDSYPWPSLSQPVSLKDAIAAVTLGNARILARYLREPEDPYFYPVVASALADLLDPSSALKRQNKSPASALFGAWGGDCIATHMKLVFVRQGRGAPKTTLDYWIGHMVQAALGKPPNVEAAVASVMDRAGVSRATAYRGWRTYRSKCEAYSKHARSSARASTLRNGRRIRR